MPRGCLGTRPSCITWSSKSCTGARTFCLMFRVPLQEQPSNDIGVILRIPCEYHVISSLHIMIVWGKLRQASHAHRARRNGRDASGSRAQTNRFWEGLSDDISQVAFFCSISLHQRWTHRAFEVNFVYEEQEMTVSIPQGYNVGQQATRANHTAIPRTETSF